MAGIDPQGCDVLALTAFRAGDARRDELHRRVTLRLEAAAREWARVLLGEKMIASIRAESATVPRGAIAVLPPGSADAARGLLGRAGLGERTTSVSPEMLVDPAAFGAKRFPVALYAGGEDYLHTVRAPGDAANAVVRYVEEGGTLVLLASQPWPLFYATGPGLRRVEPLTERLGLPLAMALEDRPAEELLVRACAQDLVTPSRAEFPYPPGDPRLRAIERQRLPAGAAYTPIARVVGKSGKDYGDAAGLIELPAKNGVRGGRILYISHNLLRDPVEGPAFLAGALRFLVAEAKRGEGARRDGGAGERR